MLKFYEKVTIGTLSFNKTILGTGMALILSLAGEFSHAQSSSTGQYEWQKGDCYLEFDDFEASLPLGDLTVLNKRESYQNITLFLEVEGFSHVSVQYSACHHLVTTLVFEMDSKTQLNAALDFAAPFINSTNRQALPVIRAIWGEIGKSTNGGILYAGGNNHEQYIQLTETEGGYRLELQISLSA